MKATSTKYTKKHSRGRDRGSVDQNKPIIIADSSYNDEIVQYRCEPCGLLIGLRRSNISDKQEIECSRCKNIIAIANARKLSKLITPHKNTEALIADPRTILSGSNLADRVRIHHEPEPQGAFKMLQDKGLRIKNYKEDLPK